MKHILAILMLVAAMDLCAQPILVRKGEANLEPRLSRYSFCVSLLPAPNSAPVSYGIHQLAPDGTVNVTFMRYESFLRQFGGAEQSRANPDHVDFMEKFGISQKSIRELWKLRYASYPFGKSKEPGWGRECGVPSDGQMQVLKQYGIENVGDVIYGDSLLHLLMDMENPAWVEQYKAAK